MSQLTPAAVKLIACEAVLLVSAVIAVALRMLAIRILKRALKIHDWLSLLSLSCLIGYIGVVFWGTVDGVIGQHLAEITDPSRVVVGLKAFYASTYFFTTVTASNRFCILFLLIEIFCTRRFRIVSYVVAALVSGWFVGSILTSLLLCRPIAANWDKTIPATCGDTFKVEIASAAWNIILDLTLVVLPMRPLWGLQMSTDRKIGISAAFALGIVIAGVNIGRLAQTLTADQSDFAYVAVDASILAVAEASIGIIVAAIPVLGPVVAPKRFTASKYQHHGATSARPFAGNSGQSKSTAAGGSQNTSSKFSVLGGRRDMLTISSGRGARHDDDIEMLVAEIPETGIAVTKSVQVTSEQQL